MGASWNPAKFLREYLVFVMKQKSWSPGKCTTYTSCLLQSLCNYAWMYKMYNSKYDRRQTELNVVTKRTATV